MINRCTLVRSAIEPKARAGVTCANMSWNNMKIEAGIVGQSGCGANPTPTKPPWRKSPIKPFVVPEKVNEYPQRNHYSRKTSKQLWKNNKMLLVYLNCYDGASQHTYKNDRHCIFEFNSAGIKVSIGRCHDKYQNSTQLKTINTCSYIGNVM